jgi:hypothetical protein
MAEVKPAQQKVLLASNDGITIEVGKGLQCPAIPLSMVSLLPRY